MAHGPARAEPGEVRYLVLDSLREKSRHGYQIIQIIEGRSSRRYRPSPGTIYPYLQLLEELGHVTSRREANRTVYEITVEGLADLESHRDDVDEAYERLNIGSRGAADLDFSPLAGPADRLRRAVRSALRRGRVGQTELQAIAELLEDSVSRIEGILSGGEPHDHGSEEK